MSEMDTIFGKAAVLLDYITPQQLNEALLHKEEFGKVQLDISLSQILVNKNYIASDLVEEIKNYASKLPKTQRVKFSSTGDIPQQYEKKIGRYFILSTLGKGAMGNVFQAYDPHLDRVIALKVLTSLNNETNIERFRREARTMGQLTHPNIVAVYDISNEDQQYFFAMDLVEGQTLDALLQNETISFDNIVEITLKIASAIEYAHSHGVIHRDLKPANILLTRDNEPKITDFGLAKVSYEEQKLSQSGMIIGTLRYMPPEQAAGKLREIDQRSDIYSLGAVLYEMITSFPPFSAPTFNQLVSKIIKEDPILPRGIRPDVPKELEAICLKALNKKPENRYQNAKELIWDIKAFKQGNSIQASAVHLQKILIHQLKKHKYTTMLGCFVIAVMLMLIAFYSKSNSQYYESLQKFTLEIEKIEKEVDFSISTKKIPQNEIESKLISLVNMNVLLKQSLIINPKNTTFLKKKFIVNKHIIRLAMLIDNNFLARLFLSELPRNQRQKINNLYINKKQRKIQEKYRQVVQDFFHELEAYDNISDECINVYANKIAKIPAEYIYVKLFADIRNKNLQIAKVSARSLAKLNIVDKFVTTELPIRLQDYINKKHDEMIKEIIWIFAYLHMQDPKNKIFFVRESNDHNFIFLKKTVVPYCWIPINKKEKNLLLLGRMYAEKKLYSKAKKILQKTKNTNQILAQIYFHTSDLTKAQELSKNLIADEKLYHLRVETLLEQGKWKKILKEKDSLFTSKTQENYYLAIIYAHHKDNIKAFDFPKIDVNYQNLRYLISSGVFYRKKEDFEKSLLSFFYTCTLYPKNSNLYLQIALTISKMGDNNTAFWYFDKALFLSPMYSDIYLHKAEVYYKKKMWTKVNFMCAKYLEKNNTKKKVMAYFLRGKSFLALAKDVDVLMYKNTLQSAINNFTEVLNIEAKYTRAYFFRAQVYELQGKFEDALQDLKMAKKYTKSKKNKAKIEVLFQKILQKNKGK